MKHGSAMAKYHRVAANSDDAAALDPVILTEKEFLRVPQHAEERRTRGRMMRIALVILLFIFLASIFVSEFGSAIPQPSKSEDTNVTKEVIDGADSIIGEDAGSSVPPLEEDDTAESPTIPWSSKAMQQRCSGWSPDFASKFKDECEYWIPVFANWEQALEIEGTNKSVVYACDSVQKCNGWGDRISGLVSAFVRALHEQRKFKVDHPFFDQVFQPCLFTSLNAQWTAQKYVRSAGDECSMNSTLGKCSGWNALNCDKSNLVAVHPIRTCFQSTQCSGLADVTPNFSSVNLVGCALRAMFEPKMDFLEGNEFEFRIQGTTRNMTLKAIRDYLASYYVIGMHVRLGDAYSFGHGAHRPVTHDLWRPIRCAQTVESYLTDESLSIDGKKVIWLLATDSESYKNESFSRFSDRIVGFDIKPKHTAQHDALEFYDFAKEIAEWYILGLVDQLVVTKWNPQADMYDEGHWPATRLSGFSRSAWLYNLKETIYFAGTCELEMVDLTAMTILSKECKNSTRLTRKLPQPHLEILRKNRKTFPEYYVSKGKIERYLGPK